MQNSEEDWDDGDNQDDLRPSSVKVQLYADGQALGEVVTLADPSWQHTWSNLPVNADGQAIVYTVEEIDVPTGYTVNIDQTTVAGNIILTNSHAPAVREIVGTKTWDDQNNQECLRPTSLTLTLLANGEAVDTQVITGEVNVWEYRFTNKPVYMNGEEIVYTVTEEVVAGYELTSPEGDLDLVNYHKASGKPDKPTKPQSGNSLPNTGEKSLVWLALIVLILGALLLLLSKLNKRSY